MCLRKKSLIYVSKRQFYYKYFQFGFYICDGIFPNNNIKFKRISRYEFNLKMCCRILNYKTSDIYLYGTFS